MQQLSPAPKCVTRAGWSNEGCSLSNKSNTSRFQREDRGDPTVTQIHFKRLALGMLTDRRWLRREPAPRHYAGRMRRGARTWRGRSPRRALVHVASVMERRALERGRPEATVILGLNECAAPAKTFLQEDATS